jgi:hypothetical protein
MRYFYKTCHGRQTLKKISMELKVPVKPHIRKFLLKKYDTVEPIKISSQEYLGDVFTSAGLSLNRRNKRYSITAEDYDSHILLDLNFELSQFSLSNQVLKEINVRLEMIFKNTMYDWTLATVMNGGFASKGLKNFLAYYRVQNDYSFETAHRAWSRFINNEYDRKKVCVS